MSYWRSEYPEVGRIADERGWTDETICLLFMRWISRSERRYPQFRRWLDDVIAQEQESGAEVRS